MQENALRRMGRHTCWYTGQIVAAEHLAGARQAIDLMALISATAWAQMHDCECIIWSDSLSTVKLACAVLSRLSLCSVQTNLDLWREFLSLVSGMWPRQILVKWIQDQDQATDVFEELRFPSNARADLGLSYQSAETQEVLGCTCASA